MNQAEEFSANVLVMWPLAGSAPFASAKPRIPDLSTAFPKENRPQSIKELNILAQYIPAA
jgi:hypothetical protein